MDVLRIGRTDLLRGLHSETFPAQAGKSKQRDGPGKPEKVSLSGVDTAFRISYDKDIGRTMVQIFDTESGKVVRQLPPEDVVAFLKRFRKVVPQFIDTTV
ncbi:MAG TPA: flagellar protein FlaG [Syntrophorhabdales bacterium]|nr:flagellar protein FlaG [Syntrophorhabdales bacterium]